MVYRSLLLHLDDDPSCAGRIAIAAALARRFEAHVTGLSASGRIPLGTMLAPGLIDVEFIQQFDRALHAQAQSRVAVFGTVCRAQALRSFEAVVDDADAADSLIRHGRCSDLVLVGAPDPADPAASVARQRNEQLMLHAAGPVLVLPHAVAARYPSDAGATADAAPGRRVLVGWDGGRECSRALADALPLLLKPDSVDVIRCRTALEDADPAAAPTIESLAQWLAWHGVDARLHSEVTQIDVGEALLSRAADLGADLLVTGAYGHARWRERLLGGVTRTLLERSPIALLMSR